MNSSSPGLDHQSDSGYEDAQLTFATYTWPVIMLMSLSLISEIGLLIRQFCLELSSARAVMIVSVGGQPGS